ncbi:hypothetical protein [Coleofasciculus sp. E1-EBD-02]|uniref:hypothetical protein n=1 Tax=Coleofasciculus sp. E1-EBD-02 TaxID=3068481 RepID=UPI003305515E
MMGIKLRIKSLLFGFVVIGLSACSTSLRVGWFSRNLPTQATASYNTFTGTERQQIEVDAGDEVVLDVQSEVTKGDLDIRILEPDQEVLKRIETNRDREYTFEAEATGNYWVVITGDNAGGSYEIQWDITS